MHNLVDGKEYISNVNYVAAKISLSLHYWKQRSKEKWLCYGYVPSKLMFSRMKRRQVHKEIVRIKDENGVFRIGQEEVHKLVQNSLKEVYRSNEVVSNDNDADQVLRELDLPHISSFILLFWKNQLPLRKLKNLFLI